MQFELLAIMFMALGANLPSSVEANFGVLEGERTSDQLEEKTGLFMVLNETEVAKIDALTVINKAVCQSATHSSYSDYSCSLCCKHSGYEIGEDDRTSCTCSKKGIERRRTSDQLAEKIGLFSKVLNEAEMAKIDALTVINKAVCLPASRSSYSDYSCPLCCKHSGYATGEDDRTSCTCSKKGIERRRTSDQLAEKTGLFKEDVPENDWELHLV